MANAAMELAKFRPPAPVPREEPLGVVGLIRTLRDNPLEAWTRTHFEEPIVIARLPLGQVAVVSDPAAIRRVLLDNAANYRKDTLQRRIVSAGFNNGLLMAEAEQWRFQRRTLAPLFTARTVAGFAPMMMEAVAALVERWQAAGDGATIDVAADVTGLTLDVLRQTIFSDGLGRDTDQIREAMRIYFDTIGQIDPFDVLNMPEMIPRLTRWKARPTLRFFETAVDQIIVRRRRRLAREPGRLERDILTLLLEARDGETGRGLTETEIKANIITFIAAGHETTANTLAWSLFLLSQSPAWSERVAAEAARECDGPRDTLASRLVETRAVIDEALRLYPPLAAISRQALAPDELAGQAIPAGTTVVIAPYVLHRSPRLWEAPDLFDPSRFLDSAHATIDRHAYLPFGAGPRICIGASFALQEATLTLAAIMRSFRLAMAPGHAVWPLQRVTLRPRGGLPMRISMRRESRFVAEPERASWVHPQQATPGL
ncbi:MAG TPA: cytochrome P450 [Xanthobacteraceae bacterium]|nr:cytochrome P450 [Xanthobacteraceae bacterium]